MFVPGPGGRFFLTYFLLTRIDLLMIFVLTRNQHERNGAAEMEQTEPRKIRQDLTKEELERPQKYGSVEFKSAGATRKR
jgi:hypothetical protein